MKPMQRFSSRGCRNKQYFLVKLMQFPLMDVCHGLRLDFYLHVPEPLQRYKQEWWKECIYVQKISILLSLTFRDAFLPLQK